MVGKLLLRELVPSAIRSNTPAGQVCGDKENRVRGIDLAIGLAIVIAIVHVRLLADAVAECVIEMRVGGGYESQFQ